MWAYATIPSVEEILVVHSTQVVAELSRRDVDASWSPDPERIEADGTLDLRSVDLRCPLRTIYAGTYPARAA